MKASPANTCHTCLTANLGIGFRNRLKSRLLHHHGRRRVLKWQNDTIGSRSDIILRGRGAVYVGTGGREVRVIYSRRE